MVPSVTETLARSALSGLIDRYAMKLQFGIASFFATVPTVVFCTAWFTGCALIESPAERGASIAAQAGMLPVALADQRMRGFLRGSAPGKRLAIYVESDGAPWIRSDLPPNDPTPVKPVVMQMATADKSAAVGYLGRPCQYLDERGLGQCDAALWTSARFREDAVAMTNAAVEQMKRLTGAARIDLIGYSGGGAMAALVAARRSDISCLVTMASPLDTAAWTAAIGVSQLAASLNPADLADRLEPVPQVHLRGVLDPVVPPATTTRYLARMPKAVVIDLPRFDHECCWGPEWLDLRDQTCLVER